MKSQMTLLALGAIALVSLTTTPATAGDYGACTASTQVCLDKMAAKMATAGWSGIEGDYDEASGVFTVSGVVAGSPAEAAGIEAGHRIVGQDGRYFKDIAEAEWAEISRARVPGKQITYLAKAGGEKVELTVTLAKMPEDVIATKIGKHMVDHAQVASVQ